MKRFLIVSSFLEGATGLVLMVIPSFVINLLLGSPLGDPVSIIITKVGGSALVAVGIACWYLRKNENITGLIIALLFYNLASVVLFGYAGLYKNFIGVALWPALVTHVVMAIWNTRYLRA